MYTSALLVDTRAKDIRAILRNILDQRIDRDPFPAYGRGDSHVIDAGAPGNTGEVDIAMVEAGATEHGHRLVEAGAQVSDEATVARGLEEAKAYIGQLIDMQLELREATVEKGDSLLLYTDGVIEATNREGEPYGMSRLRRVFEAVADESVHTIRDRLMDDVSSWLASQSDDIALLVARQLN